MQPLHPSTHRLRCSHLQPASPPLPITDERDPTQELHCYVSVLPEQVYDPLVRLANRQPEAELMRAVLEDALLCFHEGLVCQGRRVQRLAREAQEWLFSDDASWPFSFVSICAFLGLEPEYMRRGLKCWSHNRPPTAAKKRPHVVKTMQRLAA